MNPINPQNRELCKPFPSKIDRFTPKDLVEAVGVEASEERLVYLSDEVKLRVWDLGFRA